MSMIRTFIVIAFLFVVALVLRSVFGMISLGVLLLVALGIYCFRVRIKIWLSAKLAEWASDLKQLKLWLSLAFKRDRDAQSTAAMAHQQQFLSGRIMSPMNLFAIAAICVALVIVTIPIEEWRIGRIKRERDAGCSDAELSLNHQGRFRTTRMACAALGATLSVAAHWRDRATDALRLRDHDIAQIRGETQAQLVVERARRARAEASASRQRRRQNEAVIAALGGPPPDLERSVCELAGGSDCGPASAANGASAPAAAPVPAGSGDAAAATGADAPASNH